MKKHTCKNPSCNRIFEYCRGCLLSPIPHKDAGFCSKECYEASKKVVEPIVEKVEIEPIVEEIIAVEEAQPIVEDTQPIEEEISVEAESETIVLEEAPVVEKPTIKKETNTYKNKKNKYKYTSSY